MGNGGANFEPLHKGHAIEQMTLSIQMDREIDATSIRTIRNSLGTLPELPRRQDLREFTLAIGGSVATPRPSQMASGLGFSFAKYNPDGTIETELKVERSALVFHTTQYSAWQIIWPQAFTYIKTVLPHYVPKVSILGLGLVYVDKFVWSESQSNEADPKMIILENSPFLCPHVYKQHDLWHCHSGSFERIDAHTKRLLNVNIDFVDLPKEDQTFRAVVITTALTDLLNQQGYERLDSQLKTPELCSSYIDSHFNRLHEDSKNVLFQIISEEMSRRIALKG